ncbi:MAG TPA: cytochrome C oxidase subunit IV family protein [Acidimicrobiia bacterium]|jgi:cytochrome c oxidase subunit 4|nr:cytochrome C oxidase subunit IV family protein [Acidimicrobiia bacterium]
MTDSTDVVDTDNELVPADASGGELVPADAQHPVAAEGHAHPGPRQYITIGVILVILTGIEVAVSYIDTEHSNIIILTLAAMATVKFFLVCAWYMHMKQDLPFFRRLFIVGIALASIVYGIVFLFFSSTVLKS